MKLAVLGVMCWLNVVVVVGFSCRPVDCAQLQCYRTALKSGGPYRVYPDDRSYFFANCVTVTGGGGWTVMQRRMQGDLPFNKPWRQYKFGFGMYGPGSDTWLGNEHVYRMSTKKHDELTLRVDATARDTRTMMIMMQRVSLLSEDDDYRLVILGAESWQGVTGNDLAAHNGHGFSTFDHGSNAMSYGDAGGWWFTNTTSMYLNGLYATRGSNATGRQYMTAVSFDGLRPLKTSRMLIRSSRFTSVSASCTNPCAEGGSCKFLHYQNRSVCACPVGTCGVTCQSRVGCDTTTTTTSTAAPVTATAKTTETIDHFESIKDEATSHVSFSIAIFIMAVIIGGVYLNACRALCRMHLQRRRRLAARAKKQREQKRSSEKKRVDTTETVGNVEQEEQKNGSKAQVNQGEGGNEVKEPVYVDIQ